MLWQAAAGPAVAVSALVGAILGLRSALGILPPLLTLLLAGLLGVGGGILGAGLGRLMFLTTDRAGQQ